MTSLEPSTPTPEPTPEPTTEPTLEPTTDAAAQMASTVEPVDLDQLDADLRAVDRALERLDAGVYARCELCDDSIDDAVLASEPTATVCAAHLGAPGA